MTVKEFAEILIDLIETYGYDTVKITTNSIFEGYLKADAELKEVIKND